MKKKVAFITVHIGINVGSNLQAIATSEVLKKVGYSPILINYIPPRVTYNRYWSRAKESLKFFLWSLLNFPRFFYLNSLFKRYLKRHCEVSKEVYSEDDFKNSLPPADIYMTGSDQVWNFKWNEGFDYHYFFTGIEGKKVSFSSSIGLHELSEEQKDILKNELADYFCISVREDLAVTQLKEVGIHAIQLIDPTLMLSKEEGKY